MIANIFISILFLLLTAVLQYISLQSHNAPGAERGLPSILFPYVLPALFLIIASCQWRKIGVFKRRAWMAENPAPFSPDLTDCYVRFKGRITEGQTQRLPLSNKECAYYSALVAAEWEVKAKKPGRGWETVRKPLLREQSADEVELADKDHRVYIQVDEFTKSALALHNKEKTQAQCPPQVKVQNKTKYKKYQLTEHFILHNERVTAQGRLTRNRDGRLFIRPTRRLGYPSFLLVQKEAIQFKRNIIQTARNDAWNQIMRVAFLLLNVGLLLYFWWFAA
ncbi:MAG: hypothetical protein WGN25_04365 [Candidatus Electrothrix sp. GW3-4]|uniref:hypothetical protein n=1 Tax=Candidatus Electrothrix sp. GW3-4 TaxID=3126740 RepID=UPI0030D51C31